MVISTLLATFLAGVVESIETLTVVLAAGLSRNWKSAYFGLLAGILTLALVILIVGKVVINVLPLHLLNVVIGLFLLLFGSRWLVKAVQRYGGAKTLRDESEAFERMSSKLSRDEQRITAWEIDRVAFSATYGATVLEGSEVAFAVISFGSIAHMMPYALIGSAAGIVAVAFLGMMFRRPLASAPENGIKYVVGVMLTALGTLWTGEGVGVHWVLGDASYPGLLAVYVLFSIALILIVKGLSGTRGRTGGFASAEAAVRRPQENL
ncbi:MAG TPA: hypothetical protein DD856_09705 [Sulfobacillus sp.]|nr:hypothetical protein [Sulfobacillus sp.]